MSPWYIEVGHQDESIGRASEPGPDKIGPHGSWGEYYVLSTIRSHVLNITLAGYGHLGVGEKWASQKQMQDSC